MFLLMKLMMVINQLFLNTSTRHAFAERTSRVTSEKFAYNFYVGSIKWRGDLSWSEPEERVWRSEDTDDVISLVSCSGVFCVHLVSGKRSLCMPCSRRSCQTVAGCERSEEEASCSKWVTSDFLQTPPLPSEKSRSQQQQPSSSQAAAVQAFDLLGFYFRKYGAQCSPWWLKTCC